MITTRAKMLSALSRVPSGTANQEPVKEFVDTIHGYEAMLAKNVTTTSTVLTNIPALTVPLAAKTQYEFEAKLYNNTSNASGTKFAFRFLPLPAYLDAILHGRTSAGPTVATEYLGALNVASSAYYNGLVWVSGFMSPDAIAGDFSVEFLKAVSGLATMYAGSFLRVRKIAFWG